MKPESMPEKIPNPSQPAPLGEILTALAKYRRWLAGLYVGGLALCIGIVLFNNTDEWSGIGWTLAVAAAFCGLQALFLWGGGRVRLGSAPVKFRRRIVSLLLFTTIMALLTAALFMVFFQMTKGMDDPGTFSSPSLTTSAFWSITGTGWLVWLVFGFFLVRKHSQQSGLSKLIATIMAGSWIEFTVALPIYYATRRRVDCFCASESFLAMIATIPVMLWAVGPALYLFYLREKDLCEADPAHARQILREKTEMRRPRANQDEDKTP